MNCRADTNVYARSDLSANEEFEFCLQVIFQDGPFWCCTFMILMFSVGSGQLQCSYWPNSTSSTTLHFTHLLPSSSLTFAYLPYFRVNPTSTGHDQIIRFVRRESDWQAVCIHFRKYLISCTPIPQPISMVVFITFPAQCSRESPYTGMPLCSFSTTFVSRAKPETV